MWNLNRTKRIVPPSSLGRAIVRHTRLTRRHRDRRFPLTARWIMRVSRKLGHPVGRDTAYRIQHDLIEQGVIVPAGSYPQKKFGVPTGFKVKLWREADPPLRSDRSSVPAPRRRKPRAWWEHPLFGNPDGEPPPGSTRKQRKRWRSALHRAHEKERAWLAGEVS